MKDRIFQLDLIRTVAIILVIFQHSWSILDLDIPAQVFSYHGYKALIYGVPLFVMLSGFFQLQGGPKPVGSFLKNRFGRILPPFFFWMVIVYILSALTGRYQDITSFKDAALAFFPYFLENKINIAFWYVFMLSGLYLITPVLQRAIDSSASSKRLLEYCLGLWIIMTVLCDFLPQFELVRQFPIAGRYLGYYLAGYYVIVFLEDSKVNLPSGIAGFMVSFTANVLLMYAGHEYLFLEVLEVLSLFLALKSVQVRKQNLFTRATTSISRYSYTIYLTHFMLIRFLCSYFPQFFPQHWATPVYTTFIVLAAEYLFCFALDKIKFIPDRLTGIS